MWVYWMLFFVPAFFAFKGASQSNNILVNKIRLNCLWWLVFVTLTLVIGYRYEVGGDWLNYLSQLYLLKNRSLESVPFFKEPIYRFLLWLGNYWGGIYLFNCIAASVFSYGLIKYCLHLLRPWLALAISIPYMVIVVAMGYTRQGASLGILMLGLLLLEKKKSFKYLIYIFIGHMFHQTLIMFSPLILIFKKQSLKGENLFFLIIGVFSCFVIFQFMMQGYKNGYLEQKMNSSGALIRIYLNFIPAILYFFFKSRFVFFTSSQHKIISIFSVLSVMCICLYYLGYPTTAIDRFALYFMPLQLIIWSAVPDVFGETKTQKIFYISIIIIFYGVIEYIWLFYSNYSNHWVPYHFYWWEILMDRVWG